MRGFRHHPVFPLVAARTPRACDILDQENLVKLKSWLATFAISTLVPCAQSAQTLVSERTLSADAAMQVATAALAACRTHGSRVTITVLDHGG
jgi:hypothetical protein